MQYLSKTDPMHLVKESKELMIKGTSSKDLQLEHLTRVLSNQDPDPLIPTTVKIKV